MKYLTKYKMMSTVLAFGILGGCGTFVPEIQEFYETPHDAQTMVDAIVNQVRCEVRTAVQFLILDDMEAEEVAKANGLDQKRRADWLDTWAAQVTLTLTIDENSALNPGVAFNTPILPAVTSFPGRVTVSTPQNYSLGLGGTFSTGATRKETLALFIDFKDFTNKVALEKAALEKAALEKIAQDKGANTITTCGQDSGVFIQSDLKLREWLYDVALPAYEPVGQGLDYAKGLATEAKLSKKDVISHEITFVIVNSGNITPSWKLVRVSANQGSGTLFNAQRSRTQDLLITLGPPASNGGSNATGKPTSKTLRVLSTNALNSHLAAQIGLAVADAIRSTQ